jgi:malate synthase
VLTPEALGFVADLERTFGARRRQLLARRKGVQTRIDAGERPSFPAETAEIRASSWKVAEAPADLRDRRVEITGPVDRKMIINALNSGANVFMADFEDSSSPTFANGIEGQANLQTQAPDDPLLQEGTGKAYRSAKTATLVVRPRGWHLPEAHLEATAPCSGRCSISALLFHNARSSSRGDRPYFYLPKMESRPRRLWNDVSSTRRRRSASRADDPRHGADRDDPRRVRDGRDGGSCASTWAELRARDTPSASSRSSARTRPSCCPTAPVTMDQGFLRDYSLLVKTCHRRGAYAMGGWQPRS